MKNKNIQLEKVIREESMPASMFIHTKEKFKEYNSAKQNSDPVKRFGKHWHKELEINYVLDGKCDYFIDEKHYIANSGDIVIINSESIHKVSPKMTKPSNNTMAFTILINHDFMKKVIPDYENCFFSIDNIKDLTTIRICMQKILNVYRNNTSEYMDIAISGLLYELIYELCINGAKEIKTDTLGKDTKKVKDILSYIMDNYKEPIKQKDVANKFYFSREYFSRYFKRYTGTTFKEYLISYRLEKAMERIIESDDSMTNIAIDTGFADSRQFIKYFKKSYGITPYQYKLNINKASLIKRSQKYNYKL